MRHCRGQDPPHLHPPGGARKFRVRSEQVLAPVLCDVGRGLPSELRFLTKHGDGTMTSRGDLRIKEDMDGDQWSTWLEMQPLVATAV